MASEIKLPRSDDRHLVGDVESMGDAVPGRNRDREDRDESIIRLLRDQLKNRDVGNHAPPRRQAAEGEDKYEPQRLNRKICWQYDNNAHKVPLLRRHYI